MSKKIVFFGSGPVAAESLTFLSRNFDVAFVVTKRKALHFKGVPPVEKFAVHHDIKIKFADSKAELDNLLSSSENYDLGIVIDYGVIISQKTISLFRHGIINSHFSILPEWRGADPITYSLLSGQNKTGVSIMAIDSGLDTGSLYATSEIVIEPFDTNGTLTAKLINISNDLLKEYIPKILTNNAKPHPQPSNAITTYSRKLLKDDGIIDCKKTATEIIREIRAFEGWPKSSLVLPGEISVIILMAKISLEKINPGVIKLTDDNSILVGTKKNSIEITRLMPKGKKAMHVKDFLNGYGSRIKS